MSLRNVYFFKDNRYLRYDIDSDTVDVAATEISNNWPRLPEEFQSDLDATINWGDGRAYFFKGFRYLRYDIDGDIVDVGPTAISDNWTALPASFQTDLDTAVNWGDGFAYFFKGPDYLRYNIDKDIVDVGPTAISNNWPALPAEFQSHLDAAFNWGDGHAYFFKGPNYVRYDIGSDTVDIASTPISTNWTALPAEFQANVGSVLNWSERYHWEKLSRDRRMLYAMERLVDHYGYPAAGAAGLVGNLMAESGVIPTRIEGSAEATPMRSKNFAGQSQDFTAKEVRDRSQGAGVGPALPGIGLAQWTSTARRTGMFQHGPSAAGSPLGARAVFNMDGQLDYLVRELQSHFAGVNGVLNNPATSVDQAADEVVYNFEVPGALLSGGAKLPRTDARVQQVFGQRRPLARGAMQAFTAAHG